MPSSTKSMKHYLMALLFLASTLSGCLTGDDSTDSSSVEAVFTIDPSGNIITHHTVTFDASSSLPSNGALTYKWDFTSDGSIDETGRMVDWSYTSPGEYDVTLTVSDSTTSDSQTRTITVVDADPDDPVANTGATPEGGEDCDGEDASSGNYYLIFICEMDRELSNKRIEATTNVMLDASESSPGSSDDYIAEWSWDLDLQTDLDGDGDFKNDADLSGETVEWKDLSPGEYKIRLNVTNGAGNTDYDDVTVYVNYAGRWNDFEIAGNTSNNAVDMDFQFTVVNDQDSGNTIRSARGELVYPEIDDDCTDFTPGEGNNCRAKLDLYGYNDTDEEAQNTSATPLEQRTAGDCADDTDCVWLQLSSYQFSDSTYQDGDWTITLRNEKINDLVVESLTIKLTYK